MKLTLVLSTQRSGTSLLCQDIGALGGLGRPGEHFLKLLPQARRGELNPDDIRAAIAYGADRVRGDVAGICLMANYARGIMDVLAPDAARQGYGPNLRAFLAWAEAEFEAVLPVFVFRRNTVDQALSRVLSKTTGVFNSRQIAGTADDYHARLAALDAGHVALEALVEVRHVVAERRALERIHADLGDRAATLIYEDAAADPGAVAAALTGAAARAGMAPEGREVTRALQKVVPGAETQRFRAALAELLDAELRPFL